MTSLQDILRRKRLARTPGFAGGDLLEQIEGAAANSEPAAPDVLTERNRQAVTRPRRTYNTTLTPETETGFEQWRKRNAPSDSGEDYDLRGAYQAGVIPDALGHWPDKFKKPNHPTFSNESQYSTGTNVLRAGRWDGQQFQRQAPMPTTQQSDPSTGRQRAVSFDQQTGRPNEDFYRAKDDTAGLYGAYRNWEPHGSKRGFKNSLKSGLMLMGEAVRANPDDPVTAALAGFGIGVGGGTAAPNFTNRLRRQQKLSQLGGELKSDLDLKKQQAAIDQSQMTEVELENGQRVLVPAKSAATLQSRQQEIGLRGDTLEARKKRWGQLGEHEAARDAQALYNSGAADDSAELRAEIARRLRLPADTVLPPRNSGTQVKVDDLGNYVLINPRSGAVTPTDTGAFASIQEQGRETRSRRATNAANARTRFVQGQTNQRAANRPSAASRPVAADRVTARKAAQLIGRIEQRRRTLTRADELLKANPDDSDARAMREKAQAEGEGFAAELNLLNAGYEAGPGALGYPYYKRNSGRGGVTLQGAIDAFYERASREPTAEEIANIKRYYGLQ